MRPPLNFCQVCGHRLEDAERFGRVRRVCPACGFVAFQDPKVAVVVFIEDGERVLLVRRAVDPERGKWALPAGYVDFDEDPHAAAMREVCEETGLEVAITGLLAVEGGPGAAGQPGASIVIIFGAQVVGGDPEAQDDVEALLWLGRDDPPPPIAFESTRLMLERWTGRAWPLL